MRPSKGKNDSDIVRWDRPQAVGEVWCGAGKQPIQPPMQRPSGNATPQRPVDDWAQINALDLCEASAEKYIKRWHAERSLDALKLAIHYLQNIVTLHETHTL